MGMLLFRILKKGGAIPAWVSQYRKIIYGLSFAGLLFLIIQSGLNWQLPGSLRIFSSILDYLIFITYLSDAVLNFYYTYPKRDYIKNNWLDILVFMPIILNIVTTNAGVGFIVIRNIVIIIKTFTRTRKFANVIKGIRLNTAQIVLISFGGAILVGTILLTFPTATVDGRGARFIDALFTSTSAVCVTGLIVQDTPVYWTLFGQIVILILIQLGGLGIMLFSAFLVLIFGRFTLGQRQMVQEMMDEDRNVLNMIIYIFKMTFIIEAIGALFLFIRWIFTSPNIGTAFYYSIFHSVSAFCNAGFSLFSNSLESYVADPMINIIIIALIIFGGIGYIVIYEVLARFRGRTKRLSTHSRLVLTTTTILIVGGFLLIFFFEFDHSLMHYSLNSKLLAAMFQSITPRTAGFNTISISALSPVTLMIVIVLMFIGASPGSTGGGIKTSTFTILILSLRSIFTRRANIEVYRRTIHNTLVYKAIALVVASMLLVITVFILLLAFEEQAFLPLLFETVSAFGTVGLSMGITMDLTLAGKLLIILLMFAGRLGPLTLGFALTRSLRRGMLNYPDAKVMIG